MSSFSSIERSLEGIVTKKTTQSYTVWTGGKALLCTLAPRFWKPASAPGKEKHKSEDCKPSPAADQIAVGDLVRVADSQDGTGRIIEVLPRRSRLSRRSPAPGKYASEQVLVSNVDQVIPVFAAANPEPHWNMLDRYLVTGESFSVPAVICITKIDLLEDASRQEQAAVWNEYRRIGYPVIPVSSFTGAGLDELRQALQGKISVFLGKSGVGKTSLLNAIQPGLGLRVNAVNQVTGKGRHTTTYQEMFPLDLGGAIVDTPGEREFGLWDMGEQDLPMFFPEMRPFLGQCRFGMDCRHDEEPGCAVRKAVSAGMISPRRYFSYMRLMEEV